jgi:hypothetical protein
MSRRRRLLRGFDVSVDLLAEITGRAESTIRKAQRQGPSRRLAEELRLIREMMERPVGRKRKRARRPPVKAKPPVKKPLSARRPPVKAKPPVKRPLPTRRPPVKAKPPVKKPLPTRRPPVKKPLPARRPPVKAKPPVKKPPPTRKRPVKRAPKKPLPKKYPPFMRRAAGAEELILEKLGRMQGTLAFMERSLDMSVKSFINADGTVDGELRLRNLPAEWRTVDGTPSLIATLSEAIRAMGAFPGSPPMGGTFWVSFGLRFGPKNHREIEEMAKFYKRFRGLLQIGAHYTTAQSLSTILTNALAIRNLVGRLWVKRDLPPVQLLMRFFWTQGNERPGRFKGEEGGTK